MPVPTDTHYNIKRLNVLFAVSAIALAGTVIWSILQDYGKEWRIPQQNARVWEAAIVDRKIKDAESTDSYKQAEAALQKKQEDIAKSSGAKQAEIDSLAGQIKKLQSDQSTLEFRFNSAKANLTVDESHLQDAITEGDNEKAKTLAEAIKEPRKQLAEMAETLAKYKADVADATTRLKQINKDRDALASEKSKLEGDLDLMKKKRESLAPSTLVGKISSEVRAAPLMGFINPADKPQQIVLENVQADLAVMKVPQTDRCTTCHINIAKKDFQIDNVISYLEQQVSTMRKQVLPETIAPAAAAGPAATRLKPGAVAMPEFWHVYAAKVNPELIRKPAFANRLKTILGSVEKVKATLSIDGKSAAISDPESKDANLVIGQLINAWASYDKATGSEITSGSVTIKLPANLDAGAIGPIRFAALKYVEELKVQLPASMSGDQAKILIEKYRVALINEYNIARKQAGEKLLDASPVLLAHSRLDLYVDTDSKHNMEIVGCTSCHDGSGQETDFVLAAHRARPMWVDLKTGAPVLAQQLDRTSEKKSEHSEHSGFELSSMYVAIYPEGKDTPAGSDSLLLPAQQAKTESHEASAEHGGKIKFDAPDESEPVTYIDPISGKSALAVPQFTFWKARYEPRAPRDFALVYHEWDRPMLPTKFLQANCTRCHTEVYDIKETAPVLYEGRALFTRLGCVNCHQMDSVLSTQNRKVGTDLTFVASKLSPAYINTWIWAPKAFRPTTKMPHFFMLENNSSDEEIRRTRQEARAITEYIVQTSERIKPAAVKPDGVKGSVDAGRSVFKSIGCFGCHSNLNETGEEWITTDLVKRAGMKAEEAKAAYAKMTYNERHLYVRDNLEAPEGVLNALPKYADGSPRPVFVHHGPELSGVGTKLTAGRSEADARTWLFDWLKQPRHYSSYTMMPNLRLSDQQTADLVEYLLAQKRTASDAKDTWAANLTDPDGAKLRELMTQFLLARYSKNVAFDRAVMPAELDPLAIDAMTTSTIDATTAAERVKSMSIEQKQMVYLGKKLIAHYGCMGCHKINGTEAITSACTNLSDWGQKSPDKLAFGYVIEHKIHELPPTHTLSMVNGFSVAASSLTGPTGTQANIAKPLEVAWPVVGHNRAEWLEHKLKNPRIWDRGQQLFEPNPANGDTGKPYDKTKMPSFYLTDEEVHAISTFVLSNRDRLITEKLTNMTTSDRAKTIARGRELVERFNCIGCHQTELNQPQIQQWYKGEQIIDNAPPSLRGEGNKIQHAWLFNFFKNVYPLRPLMWDGIHMPSFNATDEEWTAIIAYFSAISNKEAEQLKSLIDPINKYQEAAMKLAGGTKPADGAVGPGDDWWQKPALKSSVDGLRAWALARRQITEVEVDPTKPAGLMKAYRTILFKARFTQGLYASAYPFVDSPRPVVSDERLKLGESLFHEMQCLSCHRLGDENAAGAVKDPKGPNLSYVATRLQRRWVRHWVQEPPVIQVGTKMPQFFSGLPIFKVDGQDWAAANGLPPAKMDETRKKYGATVDDQTQLLLDFIYNAGVKGVTSIQPAAPASSEKK